MLAQHSLVSPGHIVVPGPVFQHGQFHASLHHSIMASGSANAYLAILGSVCPGLFPTQEPPPWSVPMACAGRPPAPRASGPSALNPSAPGWGPATTPGSRAEPAGISSPPDSAWSPDTTPTWVHKAVRNILSRWPKAYPRKTCPYLGRMSNEEIRALDKDLEQSRSAFLRASEAQRRLNLNTRDVNRMGAKSRPDSITPGVIHTHDVIRPGANGSQSDSTITHDVNHAHDANRPEAQSRLNSNTHDVNRPEAQSHTNLDTQDVPLAPGAAQASERTRQGRPDSPTTVVDPELPRHGGHAQDTAHAPREPVPPSPTTILKDLADQAVCEAVEGITTVVDPDQDRRFHAVSESLMGRA